MTINIKKINIKNTVARGLVLLTTALLLLRDLAGLGINKYFLLLLITCAFLLISKEKCYELVSYLIPLSTGLPGSYIFCVALIVIIAKSRNRIKVDIVGIGLCVACLIIELISAFQDEKFACKDYIIFAGPFLLTFLFVFEKDDWYDYYAMSKQFILGLGVAVVDIIGQFLSYFNLKTLLTMGIRFGDLSDVIYNYKVDGMTLTYNANTLGLFCASAALMCFLMTQRERDKWTISFGIVFAVAGIMTQSRTFALVVLFGVFLYIVLGNNEGQALARKMTVFSLSVGAMILIVSKFIPNYFRNLKNRFLESDLSNGRIGITSQYWEGFFDDPTRIPFGVGLQHYPDIYGVNMSAHFGLQEVLVSWGVVGLTVVLLMFMQMFKDFDYKRISEYNMSIPLIVLLVGMQSGQLFSNTMAYMSIIPMSAFAKMGKNNNSHAVR